MKEFLSLFSFEKENYEKIKTEAWNQNWKAFLYYTAISFFAFSAVTIVSYIFAGLKINTAVYLAYSLCSLFFFISSILYKHENIKARQAFVYLFFIMFLSFGIITCTFINPDKLAVGYIVFMIAIPLLFKCRAIGMNGTVFISFLLFIPIAKNTQSKEVFVSNLLNVISYGTLSMIITSVIMKSKLQKLLYKYENESLEQLNLEEKQIIKNYEGFIMDMVKYASSEGNPDKVINQIMEYIGEKLHSDRAYIFERNKNGSFDNTYEWCRPGVSKEIDNLQDVPFEGLIDEWYRQFEKSNNIIIYDLENDKKISERLYDTLKPQGIHSLVTGAIMIEGKMIGFYGVDNPPKESIEQISELIGMMEFVISFMIRLRNNSADLEYNANHDQLTGCRNRKALEWVYTHEINDKTPLGVLMCDLNGLKKVNDLQGHDAGDQFIARTAQILKGIYGEENVYRMGGDEFVALVMNTTIKECEEKYQLAKLQLGTTASLGTAYKETMDVDFDNVLKIADIEMYKQKDEFYQHMRKSNI